MVKALVRGHGLNSLRLHMISFACTSCGETASAEWNAIGTRVTCLRCGSATLVPGQDENLSPGHVQPGVENAAAQAVGARETPTMTRDYTPRPTPVSGATPVLDSALGFLASAQQPGEIGRLGPYRVLEVLG